MEHTRYGSDPNSIDTTGLCLLSLDGGGVRGLSTLYVLKSVMDRLNFERKKDNLAPAKPCEVFDLIGGTSTGGLIAIMLGRLEMSVDECLTAYSELAETVFGEKLRRLPTNIKGKVKPRFDSAKLEGAIKKVITQSGASETDLLNDGKERGCRTFVCTIDRDTKDMVRLRSYSLPDWPDIPATICQAALATSAATSFFEPVTFDDRSFADGALGANNPVDEVEGEASSIPWDPEDKYLKDRVKCFVSIGTGNPGRKPFKDGLVKLLSETMVQIATETEATEKKFIERWARHYDTNRYFRLNVDQGLQDIGLDEYNKKGAIKAATEGYLTHTTQRFRVRDCIQNLRLKQSMAEVNSSSIIVDDDLQHMRNLHTAPPPKAAWIVPLQRNPQFIGRKAEIAQVDTILSSDNRCERAAITGLGGIGKTQIALEFAHRWREKHPDCAVFWIPVTSLESMLGAYLEVGRQIQMPNLGQEKSSIQKLVQRKLSEESSGEWLLIFDNADDIDMWTEKSVDITGSSRRIDCLPKSRRGSILFTTRSRKAATKLAGKNVVSVREMEESMAKDLLTKSLIDQDLLEDDQAASDLLIKLTHLPLAIVQAAAYINENQISLSEYATLLNDKEQNIIEILSEEFEDEGRYADVKNPIATTWLVSFGQIQERDPLAADYLSFMACVNPKDIPQVLLPPTESPKKAIDAIGMLCAYSFVTKHKQNQLLDLHRLVHLATRNWLQMKGCLEEWSAKALARLLEAFPEINNGTRRVWKTLLPHAKYALDSHPEHDGNDRIELLYTFGRCAINDTRYQEAENALMQVFQTEKEKLGMEHVRTLDTMVYLAEVYKEQEKWQAAEESLLYIIERHKRILGMKNTETLFRMNDLALLYSLQKRWEEAERLAVQVIEGYNVLLEPKDPYILICKGILAGIYEGQERWKEAEELRIQLFNVTVKKFGQNDLDAIHRMALLAVMYQKQELWKKAEKLFSKVVDAYKKVLGLDHPETLAAMSFLAYMLWKQGFLDAAEELSLQVMDTRKTTLGPNHSDTLRSMYNLAHTWNAQKRHGKAIKLMDECFELRKLTLGADHSETKSALRRVNDWKAEARMS